MGDVVPLPFSVAQAVRCRHRGSDEVEAEAVLPTPPGAKGAWLTEVAFKVQRNLPLREQKHHPENDPHFDKGNKIGAPP